MKKMTALQEIYVPVPNPDEIYAIGFLDRQFEFRGLKKLLGAADISKAGDRTTGLAADNEMAREAARSILSGLTLQHIYDTTMAEHGPLAGFADQFMYFETGQGSEMTYRKHNGIDVTTREALCYGLCRRYDPFMVNNATGFIGPETHLNDFELIVSTLQDNFMGKLLGLPMGISPS